MPGASAPRRRDCPRPGGSSVSCMLSLLQQSFGGEQEAEGRTAVDRAGAPHLAAVTPYDPLHDREPYAGSLELRAVVQPAEHLEQRLCVFHVESGAVVPDRYYYPIGPENGSYLNFRALPLRRELDGIPDQ